jgi:hypothetical protein
MPSPPTTDSRRTAVMILGVPLSRRSGMRRILSICPAWVVAEHAHSGQYERVLNKQFDATLQKSPNKGGWTYVVILTRSSSLEQGAW